MTAAMNELQQMSERDLGRVLDKNQVKRLKEIQLQMEGAFAVLRPDVAEKLELGEDQVAQIQEIRNESNQARRNMMAANRQMFAGLRKNQNGGNPPDPNAAADQAATDNGQGRTARATPRQATVRGAIGVVEMAGAGTTAAAMPRPGRGRAPAEALARRSRWPRRTRRPRRPRRFRS